MSLSVERSLRKARRHARNGEVELAAQEYKRVLASFPQNPRAIEGLKALQHPTSTDSAGKSQPSREQINTLVHLFNQGNFQQTLAHGELLAKQFPHVAIIANVLGAAHARSGRLEDAVTWFTKALQIDPGYADGHNNLGNALKSLGRAEEAAASYQRALQIKPDFFEAHNSFGNALRDLGDPDAAIASYHRALEIKPRYADAHNNLGNALRELGNPSEAVNSYQKALQIKPDFVEAHYNLGNSLKDLGRTREAIASYRKALQYNSDFVQAHYELGNALKDLGEAEEAAASYRKALLIRPDYVEAHNSLGNALNDLGKPEEAIASFHNALQISADYVEAHNNLGNALKHLGKREEAIESYQKALQIKPDYFNAYINLSTVKKYRDGDPQIQQMLQLANRPGLLDEDRVYLGFALSKAFDDIGEYDESFQYLSDGNRLRKAALNYDSSTVQAEFSAIKSTFSRDLPALDFRLESDDGRKQKPIFVLGMPRSGTTLVEQILASHSQVYGAGELTLLSRSVNSVRWKSPQLSLEDLQSIRKSYLSGLANIGASESHITDKMPFNFHWIGFILAAIPESKIVHVKRDACATCWSNYKLYFPSKAIGFAYDFRDLVEYYKMYRDLMDFWHEKYPGKIHDLQYEALTEHQEAETRKLLDYLGLEWESQCERFYETERSVRTASADQVRQRIYQGSSDAWRKYERHLQPMIELLRDF